MSEASPGDFVWYDLLTTDPAAAVAFYEHVVGWESRPVGPHYTVFTTGLGPVGGARTLPERARKAGAPAHWTANVRVADVDAAAARVVELGGRVLTEPTSFPDVGRVATIADPQGATLELFSPSQPLQARDRGAPGEFAWSELLATDHEAALRFYAALFGWKKQREFDVERIGKYVTFAIGDREAGGMFTKPKAMPAPPHWIYYCRVADLDGAIERATARGGKLVNGPIEVPGGARVAQLDDPQGAGFALHAVSARG